MDKIFIDFLNVKDEKDVIEKFLNTLIDTNRSYNYFVDWKKVKNNVEKHKIEFHLFDSLLKDKNFDNDLRKILSNYPNVLPLIPILLAIREQNRELKVIDNFEDKDINIVTYDFTPRNLSQQEIDSFVDFFYKTGLKKFFLEIGTNNIYDYVLGIEVGMDTNARKNRGGTSMELLLKPLINNIVDKKKEPIEVLYQKKFKYLETNYGIKVDSSIKDRKADFILIGENNKIINLEVNFFSGAGSKPIEIVDSYIQRQSELKKHGFEFIWITDGDGWSKQKNQLDKAFRNIDYLLNIYFVRLGLLEKILCEIL
jgi:type II restriction enzyme